MDLFGSLKGKAGGVVSTAGDLGKVLVDTLEKASGATLDSYRYYSDAGMHQLRAFAGIRDVDSLRGFFSESVTLSADLVKHSIEDLQRSLALAAEMRIAIEDALSTVTPPEPVPAPRTKGVTKSIPV